MTMDNLRIQVAMLTSLLVGQHRLPHANLTRSEMRVLILLAQGYSERLILRRMNIARQTLCNHRTGLYRKLGVRNCTQAARYAWQHGIVDPEEAWDTVMTLQWRELPGRR